jgi:hypothetical protein
MTDDGDAPWHTVVHVFVLKNKIYRRVVTHFLDVTQSSTKP